MATDALIALQASVTKTATFNGSAVTLAGGTPRRGLVARVIYSAATNASGSNTVTFSIDASYDGGSNWFSDFVAADKAISLSTTAQSGEIFIPFSVSPSSIGGSVQIRLTATVAGAGSTPTITYQGDIQLARP